MVPYLVREEVVGERLQWKRQINSFRKTNGFLGNQIEDKKVCEMFVYAGVSGLSIMFMTMKLS